MGPSEELHEATVLLYVYLGAYSRMRIYCEVYMHSG